MAVIISFFLISDPKLPWPTVFGALPRNIQNQVALLFKMSGWGWWSHLGPITVGCAQGSQLPCTSPFVFFKAQQWVRGLICHPTYLPQRIDLSVFRGQRPQQGNVALVPSLGLEIEWTPWTFNMSAPPSYQILHVLKCWATCTKANSFQSHSGVLSISKLLPTYFLCRDKLWPGWSSHFTKDEGRQ